MQHVAALLALLILPQQAFAYQINTTEKGKRIRWADDLLVLRLDAGFETMLANGAAPDALEIALDAWRGLPGVPDFQVKPGQPAEPGHHGDHATNGVYLLQHWPYAPDKLAITVVTYELDTGRLLDADVLVNPDAHFELIDEGAASDANAYDLAAVLSHEAGHVLGLGESEDDREATMWPYARMGETHQRTLSDDDEAGVIEAYRGPAPPPVMGCGQASVMRGKRVAPPAWLVLLGVLMAFTALRLSRASLPRRNATAAFGLGVLLVAGGVPTGEADEAHDAHGPLSHVDAHHHHTTLVSDLSDAERFEDLLGHGEARIGTLERVAARAEQGAIVTDYVVRDARGEHRFTLPGGELDGVGQIVGHGELPQAGVELLVVEDADAPSTRWAYHSEGRVWGGWLGDGPALEL